MSNVKKYLANAQRMANESFVGADGFLDDDISFSGQDFVSADGGAMSAAPTSQPYIVNITNATTTAVPNFNILGSNEFLGSATVDPATVGSYYFNANGDLVYNVTAAAGEEITISSGIPGVTYREMLYQFQANPFSVGLTYLQSATSNQILQTISVNTKDANGNTAQKALVPTIDPYQQQSTVLAMKYAYRIDGFTKLIVASVLASASMTVQFYPSDNINLARGLSGRAVSKAYGNPGIVKAQTIKLT